MTPAFGREKNISFVTRIGKISQRELKKWHVIASKSHHVNTMLPNEIVLAPLPKLKIKYELSYQTTTRLKYIDKFDQLLIIQQ
jgi:hypothetical protein